MDLILKMQNEEVQSIMHSELSLGGRVGIIFIEDEDELRMRMEHPFAHPW